MTDMLHCFQLAVGSAKELKLRLRFSRPIGPKALFSKSTLMGILWSIYLDNCSKQGQKNNKTKTHEINAGYLLELSPDELRKQKVSCPMGTISIT